LKNTLNSALWAPSCGIFQNPVFSGSVGGGDAYFEAIPFYLLFGHRPVLFSNPGLYLRGVVNGAGKAGLKAFEKYLERCPVGAVLRHFFNERLSFFLKHCKDKRVQQKPKFFSGLSTVMRADGAIPGESSYIKAPTNE